MNPAGMMKFLGAKNQFEGNHPKFAAFLKSFFGSKMEADTIIEVTVTRPGQEPVTANMKVLESDLELIQSLKDMA